MSLEFYLFYRSDVDNVVVIFPERKGKTKQKAKGKPTVRCRGVYMCKTTLSFVDLTFLQFTNDKKPSSTKQIAEKSTQDDDNEEIPSDDEEDMENAAAQQDFQFSDEEDNETPQDKRLKLAKKYLEEIELEERSRADDKDVRRGISKRLANEYLDSVGKLRRLVADELTGYDEGCVQALKHKLQKVPITCVCLSSDGRFMFSGSKSQYVVKWSMDDWKPVGFFDCLKVPHTNEQSSKKHRPQIWAMALSTDFKFLVSSTRLKNMKEEMKNRSIVQSFDTGCGRYEQIHSHLVSEAANAHPFVERSSGCHHCSSIS